MVLKFGKRIYGKDVEYLKQEWLGRTREGDTHAHIYRLIQEGKGKRE